MMRGQNEGFLSLDLEVDAGAPKGESPAERACAAVLNASGRGLGDLWLREAAAWAFRIKIKTSLSLDLMGQLREQAGAEAISVFARAIVFRIFSGQVIIRNSPESILRSRVVSCRRKRKSQRLRVLRR